MALAPLASADDLANRLGVVAYEGAELAQVNALLDDASEELRSIIGQPINRLTSTVRLYADQAGRIELPAFPVISVATVTHDGAAIAAGKSGWEVRYRTLRVPTSVCKSGEVIVTYTHGWDPIPGDLVKWTCVLAAAMKAAVDSTNALGMTAGIVSRSEAIDDYQSSWQSAESSGGDGAAGLTLAPRIADRLRATYGGSGLIDWLEVSG